MNKRILALALVLVLALALAACGDKPPAEPEQGEEPAAGLGLPKEDLKAGLILIGDAAEAYSGSHIAGMVEAMDKLGLEPDTQLIMKSNIVDSASCDAAIKALSEAGCQVIFSTSSDHEQAMVANAPDYPNIQFCAASGTQGVSDEADNTHNYYARVYEARYLSGIAAGLKTETDRLGFVAAKPNAEVISGFTAYYLGAKSVNPEAELFVQYTGSWSNAEEEAAAAQALIDMGCDVISQHTGTTAPATTAQEAGVWAVGYHKDMTDDAKDAVLVSARINWGVYYEYALDSLLTGEKIEQDWCEGLSEGAVLLSDLNQDVIAEGTAEAIELAKEGLMDGSVRVFAGPLVDVNGETAVEVGDAFHECEQTSAPTWDKIIQGVNVLS